MTDDFNPAVVTARPAEPAVEETPGFDIRLKRFALSVYRAATPIVVTSKNAILKTPLLLIRPFLFFEWLASQPSAVAGAFALAVITLMLPVVTLSIFAAAKGADSRLLFELYWYSAIYLMPGWIAFLVVRALLIAPIAFASLSATRRQLPHGQSKLYHSLRLALVVDSPTHIPVFIAFSIWFLVLGVMLSLDLSHSSPSQVQKGVLVVATSVSVLMVAGRTHGAWAASRGLRALCGLNTGLGLLALYVVDIASVIVVCIVLFQIIKAAFG